MSPRIARPKGISPTFSSDHAPYQFNENGKIPKGDKTTFKEMANGVPGLEIRLPLLFSEGVLKGRIGLQQFVALTATNHARLYGLYPRKGTIAVGSDADFAHPDVLASTMDTLTPIVALATLWEGVWRLGIPI